MGYTVIRKKRKTLGIRISETGEVLVYAPLKMSFKTIETLVLSKEKWIKESKDKLIRYETGHKINFLGKEYNLNNIKVFENKTNIELTESKFNVYFGGENPFPPYSEILDCLYRKYKNDFTKIVIDRISAISDEMGVRPNKVNVKNQRTIWGSCSSTNNISINFKLSLAPIEILDYVILHELCHIIHKNHSRDFWAALETYMPDYKTKRNWLKANSHKSLF
ncbi:MAG: M48 family metallopeptidase [Solirubrobacterales bacterium]